MEKLREDTFVGQEPLGGRVTTPTQHAKLNDLPNLERCFLLSDLHGSPEKRDVFMDEIFNHGLRITKFMASAPNPRN